MPKAIGLSCSYFDIVIFGILLLLILMLHSHSFGSKISRRRNIKILLSAHFIVMISPQPQKESFQMLFSFNTDHQRHKNFYDLQYFLLVSMMGQLMSQNGLSKRALFQSSSDWWFDYELPFFKEDHQNDSNADLE